MVRSQCLKPINKILWVVKSGVETIDAEQICIERVGEKAFGLASLPAKWTLPFFVISSWDCERSHDSMGVCDKFGSSAMQNRT